MTLPELKEAVKYLQANCTCRQCNGKYKQENVQIMATTKDEALFEVLCVKCDEAALISVFFSRNEDMESQYLNSPQENISFGSTISKNDILDMKNFLTKFDGNFKEIFKS